MIHADFLPTAEQEQSYREMLMDFAYSIDEAEVDEVRHDAIMDMARELGLSEAEVVESLNEFPLV